MSYTESMIENLESNLLFLKKQLSEMQYYPELTGTVISKYVRCSRPNCICCQSGYYHGPNLYYRYYADGELKDMYLGKKIRDEYIHKTEANKKYKEVYEEICDTETELRRLKNKLSDGGGA